MRRIGVAVLLLGVTGVTGPGAAQSPPLAVVGARLIDGNGGAVLPNATAVVRDGRIVAVGPAAEVPVPRGARILPGRGLTLMPGLADLHTHLPGGWDGDAVDFLGYRRTLGALLYAGVTTVLDPGDVTAYVKQLRSEIAAGRLPGPRIYFTGPVFDGPRPIWPDISVALSSEDQIPHFLGLLKLAGADFIKAYIGLSDAMVRALVDSSQRYSFRVIADVGPRNGSLETARTGIASFAHAGTRPMTDEAVRYMAEHGTMSLSTLAVYESFARRRFQDMRFVDHPLLRDVMPPSYLAELRAHRTSPMSREDSAMAQRLGQALGTAMGNVKRMVDAGVLVAAGTDAPYPGDFYGEGLHRELELLVEAGLTPLQAISAATRNAARFVGPGAEWGTIEPGKVADLLLVRGDPSVRIGDTRNVVTVIQGGRIVDRARLRYDPRTEPDFHPSPLRPH